MAIRVTQHTMYNNMVGHMQKNLGAYMESVEQGSSQKKINRPSDDPAGTYRVLTTRVDIDSTKQYQENVDTAKGWLNLADDVLSRQATTAITGLKTLAEQAATGTYNAEQRKIMADQARQYFGQLLNLSNTEFEGNSIFGGHKYDKNAFEEGLAATTWDEDWNKLVNNGGIQIDGATEDSVLIQFVTGAPGEEADLEGANFRWSNDGGDTWSELCTVTKEGDNLILKPEGAGITLTIPTKDADGNDLDNIPKAIGADTEKESEFLSNGSSLIIRPTAIYQGDDKDPPVDITPMIGNLDTDKIKADGSFGSNVMVRVDGLMNADGKFEDVDLSDAANFGKDLYWSYSTDGGSTWVTAKSTITADSQNNMRLPIPGGYVDISDTANIAAGSQFMVHPSRADLDYEIMKDTYLSVNSVGKDVFGGYYQGKPAMENSDQNLFEVVGAFIGYLESNSQEGCQKTLAALTTAEEKMLKEATRIGGMENRLEMASDVLSFQKIDQEERLSYVEDIDLTELLTKLTRQQLTYQTVLQSSSMIMQLSLANYI